MNIPNLNLSRLPNSSATGNTSVALVGGGGAGSQGRSIVNTEPTLMRHRGGSASNPGGATTVTPRPPPSSGNTPLSSPRQVAVHQSAPGASSASSPTNVYVSSLARRAAELAGVLDFDVMRCSDVYTLQKKVIETAERLVRAERWYEEQLRDRSSYYHHRLAHLSKYVSAIQMSNAPRNLSVPSAGNRSSSLLSRPIASGGRGGNLMGSVSRGPGSDKTTIPSKQSPYSGADGSGNSARPRPASVTATRIGSAGRASGNGEAFSNDGNAGSTSSAAVATERMTSSNTFTAMIQSILNRDRGDLQGEKDRRRRISGNPSRGGTPIKATAGFDPNASTGSEAYGNSGGGSNSSLRKRRTASKPTSGRRSVRPMSNVSSGTSTPTRKHQLQLQLQTQHHHHRRRGSVGSSNSAFSNSSAKSISSLSSPNHRKASTPGVPRRTSAGKRRYASPLSEGGKGHSPSSAAVGNTSAPGASHMNNNNSGPGDVAKCGAQTSPNDFYFTSKHRGGSSYGHGSLNSSLDSSGKLMDSKRGEVKRGSDMKPQPPSYSSRGDAGPNPSIAFNKSDERAAGGSTTPLRKRRE